MRAARLAKGWSQKQVAEFLHMSVQELSDYERGRRTPGLRRAVAIEHWLDIPVQAWVA